MRILVADDHALVRESIADALRGTQTPPPVEIATAASYDEIRSLQEDGAQPDIVLLDYKMPGVGSIAGVKRVIDLFADAPVVVLSGIEDPVLAKECIDGGAAGFVAKTVTSASLRNAIRLVLDGEIYVPFAALQAAQRPQSGAGNDDSEPSHFSEREVGIIRGLVDGHTNKQIARDLGIAEMTVKTHVRNIYRKLGTPTRAAAVTRIMQKHGGLVSSVQ